MRLPILRAPAGDAGEAPGELGSAGCESLGQLKLADLVITLRPEGLRRVIAAGTSNPTVRLF